MKELLSEIVKIIRAIILQMCKEISKLLKSNTH